MEPQSAALVAALDVLARRAGAAIMTYHRQDLAVDSKPDQSPVTAADLAAHQIIAAGLAGLAAEIPVLSEEGAALDPAERQRWTKLFIVDPLDGTKEFIRGNTDFTVNIALVEHGRPVLGVVHAPVSEASWLGIVGQGAWHVARTGQRRPISVRRPAATPLVVVASRSHRRPETDALLSRIGEVDVTAVGSSLKLCLVAEGRADFYPRLGPTCEWDTAAAHAVVDAAGGTVIDLAGAPLTYNQRRSLLNPHFLVLGDPDLPWRDWL